jgi:hypothetical protein
MLHSVFTKLFFLENCLLGMVLKKTLGAVVQVAEFSVPQCCTTQCEAKIKNRLFNIPGQ